MIWLNRIAEEARRFLRSRARGTAMDEKLTLREALASDRLDDFVGQEVIQGSELLRGSELERALALLVTQRRLLGRAFNTSALGASRALQPDATT